MYSTTHFSPFTKFILDSLRTRKSVETFENQAYPYIEKISSDKVAASYLLQPAAGISFPDPLHLSYIQCLIEKNYIPLPDVLRALLQLERSTAEANISHFVETTIAILVRSLKPGTVRRENIWATISALGDWMGYFVETKDVDLAAGSVITSRRIKVDSIYEFLVQFGQLEEVQRVYHAGNVKSKQSSFANSLSQFITYLSDLYQNPAIQSQLEALYRTKELSNTGKQANGTDLMLGDDLLVGDGTGDHDGADNMLLLARGAIYAWVNSMLIGRPLVDDDLILGYLTHRYKNETQQLVTEFVTAVFDNILSAVQRNESPTQMFILRSFLVNKVPLIISAVSVLLPPLAINDCLQTALAKGDSSALSSIPANAADPLARSGQGGADMFQLPVDVRQEFLFACSLHHVLEESAIQGILGDLPSQPGATANYSAEQLFAQFESDPEKMESYLDEIGMMDGNACAIVRAVVKTIGILCQQRRTDVLKNICGSLARRPPFIDIVIMFTKPHEILEPLCILLDTWRYDDDQGESFSFYEEFGFVLLLVLSFIYRYDLEPQDLGNISPDNFVLKLMAGAISARGEEPKLSPEQTALAGKWIKALFDEDGITDQLMGECRPQDFYMLVPTICSQGVMACGMGVLDVQALNNGFKHFLVPFLLPSLLSVLNYLSNYLWETRTDLNTPMTLLYSLVLPSSIPDEARSIHHTVIALASPQIEKTLRELLRTDPTLAYADRILHKLPPHDATKRTATAYQRELENWSQQGSHSPGQHVQGILLALRTSINSLVSWSTSQDVNLSPPAYNHKLLLTCCELLGCQAVIHTMAAELVRLQAQAALSGDIALDIISSLICAPTATEFYSRTKRDEHFDGTNATPPPPLSSLSPLVQALYAEEEHASTSSSVPKPTKDALRQIKKRVQILTSPYTHSPFPVIPNMGMVVMDTGMEGGHHANELMGHLRAAGLMSDVDDGMMSMGDFGADLGADMEF